jgi:sodium/pantothenate symporter
MPILLGLFSKAVKKEIVISASVTAVIVHFLMYYGKLPVPLTQATGENPGVAAAVAILFSMLAAFMANVLTKGKEDV